MLVIWAPRKERQRSRTDPTFDYGATAEKPSEGPRTGMKLKRKEEMVEKNKTTEEY